MGKKETKDFLVKLCRDPKLREKLKKAPDATMDAAGLTAEDKAVLRSGDPDKIREHLGDVSSIGFCVMMFV